MAILITGATGYLGSRVTEILSKKGLELVCCAKDPTTKQNNTSYVQGDITDMKFVDGLFKTNRIELVIHLAANIEMKNEKENISNIMNANVLGTANIIAAMINNKVKKIIFASSMAVIGIPKQLPVGRNHRCRPLSVYGLSKKHAEDIIEYVANEYGITGCTIRFPGLFGGGRKSGAIYNFVENALKNTAIKINLETPVIWDIMHVDDAAMIIAKAVDRIDEIKKHETFGVDYGEPVEISDVAKRVVVHAKSDSKIMVTGNKKSHPFCFDNNDFRRITGIILPKLDRKIKDLIEEMKT